MIRARWFLGAAAALGVSLGALAQSIPFPGPGMPALTKSLTYITNENKTTTCTSPCTFSNGGSHFNIGNADSTRVVHFAYTENVTSAAFTSATICGVSATVNANVASTDATSRTLLLSAVVPTGSGATCDLVVTGSSATRSSAAAWYSIGYGTATANSSGAPNGCAPCSTSVTPTTGGYIIAIANQTTDATAGSFTAGITTQRWTFGTNVANWGGDNTTASGATTVSSSMGGGGTAKTNMAVAAF